MNLKRGGIDLGPFWCATVWVPAPLCCSEASLGKTLRTGAVTLELPRHESMRTGGVALDAAPWTPPQCPAKLRPYCCILRYQIRSGPASLCSGPPPPLPQFTPARRPPPPPLGGARDRRPGALCGGRLWSSFRRPARPFWGAGLGGGGGQGAQAHRARGGGGTQQSVGCEPLTPTQGATQQSVGGEPLTPTQGATPQRGGGRPCGVPRAYRRGTAVQPRRCPLCRSRAP